MTKEEVIQRIKAILAKDTYLKKAILQVKFNDKKQQPKPKHTATT